MRWKDFQSSRVLDWSNRWSLYCPRIFSVLLDHIGSRAWQHQHWQCCVPLPKCAPLPERGSYEWLLTRVYSCWMVAWCLVRTTSFRSVFSWDAWPAPWTWSWLSGRKWSKHDLAAARRWPLLLLAGSRLKVSVWSRCLACGVKNLINIR